MDRAERLADFLAGELDPVEHAALTAELERDASLRAQLAAMRTADDALAELPPPTPPDGFESRLDAVIAAELSDVLSAPPAEADGAAEDATASVGSTDELAARRDRRARGLPRWVTAASGVAAAVIVLAGAGVLATGVLGGGDDADTFDTESLDTADDGGSESAQMESAEPEGPLLLAGDREVDQAAVEALLDDPEVFGLTERQLGAEAAASLADPYARAFGGPAPDDRSAAGSDEATDEAVPQEDGGDVDATQETEEDAGESAADGQADADDSGDTDDSGGATALDAPTAPDDVGDPAPLRIRGELSTEQRTQVATCLNDILDAQPGIVPVYAELATFEGDPVILYGLVTRDPETNAFTRREVWAADRSTCDIRLFVQD